MKNRRLKINFWGKYEEELIVSVKKNDKNRIRELFALSYLDYLDVILTPIENFGIKNEAFQNLSFTERFYLAFIKKGNPADIMNFPYSSDSYGSEVFIYFANELCLLLDEEVSSILLTENHYYHYYRKVISKNLENLINRTFDERCSKSEKIKNFIENKPDFSFSQINMEKKDRYWSKILLSSITELPEWIWCLVGNIKSTHEYGENHEIRHGSKQFSGGTKVYCYPSHWGDGYENIHVIGKPRKSRNLIMIVIKRKLIENFRLKKVYDKRVIEEMFCGSWHGWDNTDESRDYINKMLTWLNDN